MVRDRAGYWKDDGGHRLYLFTSGGLREATKGYDLTRVTKALQQAGALAAKGANGKTALTTRVPGGDTPRLYHIDHSALVSDSGNG